MVIGKYVEVNGCFYDLTQVKYRNIKKMGLEDDYRSDKEFSSFCRHLDALVF